MGKFDKTAETALKAIRKNGREFVISRTSPVFDEVTGALDEEETETITGTITAITLPRYKGTVFASMDDNLKAALLTGKMKSLLAAAKGATFAPKPLDLISIAGADWQVLGVTTLDPDGTPLLHTIGILEV